MATIAMIPKKVFGQIGYEKAWITTDIYWSDN